MPKLTHCEASVYGIVAWKAPASGSPSSAVCTYSISSSGMGVDVAMSALLSTNFQQSATVLPEPAGQTSLGSEKDMVVMTGSAPPPPPLPPVLLPPVLLPPVLLPPVL